MRIGHWPRDVMDTNQVSARNLVCTPDGCLLVVGEQIILHYTARQSMV